MSELVSLIQSIETKVAKMAQRIATLEQDKNRLQQQLVQANEAVGKQLEQIQQLEAQAQTLKMSNALLGSEEYKRDTKLKINALIRDIDACLAQLAE